MEQKNRENGFAKNIGAIEEKIGYTFRDPSLLEQAFTRTSFCNEKNRKAAVPYQSNEVLEFFGDTVLSCAIITFLLRDATERYEHGIRTTLAEGGFSNIKSKLSDKTNLSHSMRELGLQKYLQMGEGDAKNNIASEPSVMEDLFESIIAAVYIDAGYDLSCVMRTVSKMLDVSVYREKSASAIQSYKNALQEWCADKRHRMSAPVYEKVGESGPDHKKEYTVAVTIGGKEYARGVGKNLRAAESAAAEAALTALRAERPSATGEGRDTDSAVGTLRAVAASGGKPYPEFRDLGEVTEHGEQVFRVECRFDGFVTDATGYSKKEARAAAAEKMLGKVRESGGKPGQKQTKRAILSPVKNADKKAKKPKMGLDGNLKEKPKKSYPVKNSSVKKTKNAGEKRKKTAKAKTPSGEGEAVR